MMLTINKRLNIGFIHETTMQCTILTTSMVTDLQSLECLDEITLPCGYKLPVQSVGYSFEPNDHGVYIDTGSDNYNDKKGLEAAIKEWEERGFKKV